MIQSIALSKVELRRSAVRREEHGGLHWELDYNELGRRERAIRYCEVVT